MRLGMCRKGIGIFDLSFLYAVILQLGDDSA